MTSGIMSGTTSGTLDEVTELEEKEEVHSTWNWTGPIEEPLGRMSRVWVWEEKTHKYRVLRIHPPLFPVQYGTMNGTKEWRCAYVPDINTAMLSCELHYIQTQERSILVRSNRIELVWIERRELANLFPEQRWEKKFGTEKIVPISWLPNGTQFIFRGVDGHEILGKVISVNKDWTAKVALATDVEHLEVAIGLESWSMDTLVCVPRQMTLKRRLAMMVSEREARDLFVALGYKAADDEKVWPKKRLEGRINRLPDFVREANELSDENLHNLMTGVLKALKDGASVVLAGAESSDDSVTGEGKDSMTATLEKVQGQENLSQEETQEALNGEGQSQAKKSEKGKKTPKAKAPKEPKEKKEKKPKHDMDQYGCRIGSENEKLNRVLSDTPKSMGQLVKEAGIKRGLYGHIRAMMKKGFVKEEKQGEDRVFSLVKKAPSQS